MKLIFSTFKKPINGQGSMQTANPNLNIQEGSMQTANPNPNIHEGSAVENSCILS